MADRVKKLSYPLWATIKRMLINIRRNRPVIFLLFGIYTAAASIYPFLAVLLPKLMLEALAGGGRRKDVLLIAAGFFLAAGLLGFIRTYLEYFTYHKLSRLRIDYLRDCSIKVMEMAYPNTEDASFMQKYDKAFIATQSNDNGVEGIYHKLFETPALLISATGLALVIGFLSPWVLAGLLLHLLAVIWVSQKSHQYRYLKKEEEAKWRRKCGYYTETASDFSYGKDIRMYGLGPQILKAYCAQIEGYRRLLEVMAKKEYALGFASLFAMLVSDLLTYGTLIMRTVNGMSIADFSMYLTAAAALSASLLKIAEQLSFIRNEGQYVHEMFCFLDEDMGEKGGTRPAVKGDTLEVVFDHVSFCYPGSDQYVFRDLNLTIHKGERLAIVGINGAGKSTLVKLMMGLFPVTSGEIRINGIPLEEYDKKALYSMFSAVFQDVNIMAFTVRENVAGSLTDIEDDKVEKALERMGLLEKVRSFPEGSGQMLLKVIDENGGMLSGGEAQKLVIARALYKDANMVIMDEPTAALDALAEAQVYEDFDQLVQGKTAVYISHRLASTRFCDHIALFDGEGLKEYGTHEELMARRGSYYEMFTVQGKYYTEGRGA